MIDSPDSYLFVYGTLMRRFEHPMHEFLMTHAEYLCDGSFQGKLYRISWYPAVVPSSNSADKVYGEVYRIRDTKILFKTLDNYEMCAPDDSTSGEYTRQIAGIRIANGETLGCHIYLYNWKLDEAQHIPSGKFTSMVGP